MLAACLGSCTRVASYEAAGLQRSAPSDRAERLVELARDADVVLGVGDYATMRMGLEGTIEVLSAIAAPTVLVPGNAESDTELWRACADWPSARVLHGEAHLVIACAIPERSERTVDFKVLKGLHQLLRIRRFCFGDTGGERCHRHVADDRPKSRIIIVFLLVGIDEGEMILGLDLVPGIAGNYPADRSFVFQGIEILWFA